MCVCIDPLFFSFTGNLAFDWITSKIYFTDTLKRTVEVMDPETSYRKVLLNFEDDPSIAPRNIILDPLNR
jgi:DNA-binding beta-propeller fold protein YncE